MIEIKCSTPEQTLLKRSIKRCDCNRAACGYDEECDKPDDMTCGEYVVGKIKWEVTDE